MKSLTSRILMTLAATAALLGSAPTTEASAAVTPSALVFGPGLAAVSAAAACTPANVQKVGRFFTMGLRSGQRTIEDAQKMCRKVPGAIRAGGSEGTTRWLADKHGSHRTAHAAGGTDDPSNMRIERASSNLSRGSKPISVTDEIRIAVQNAGDNVRALLPRAGMIGRAAGGGAAAGAVTLAALEAACQTRRYVNGDATAREAAGEVGKRAALGAAGGALVVGTATMFGVLFPPSIPFILIGAKATMAVGTLAVTYELGQIAADPAHCG